MNSEQAAVREFMVQIAKKELVSLPHRPTAEELNLCSKLMREELVELEDALWIEHIVNIAKELADMLYVVYYTANMCGIDIEHCFELVHESNMTKTPDESDTGVKVSKGPSYVAPSLEQEIFTQLKAGVGQC